MRDDEVLTQQCLYIGGGRMVHRPKEGASQQGWKSSEGSRQPAGGGGGWGDDGEECQNAQERPELPVGSQTEPVWREARGWRWGNSERVRGWPRQKHKVM